MSAASRRRRNACESCEYTCNRNLQGKIFAPDERKYLGEDREMGNLFINATSLENLKLKIKVLAEQKLWIRRCLEKCNECIDDNKSKQGERDQARWTIRKINHTDNMIKKLFIKSPYFKELKQERQKERQLMREFHAL